MCHRSAGELPVGALVERVGLSQSALSQPLAKLREQGLVDCRREYQTLRYPIADPKVLRVLEVPRELYCPEIERPSLGHFPIALQRPDRSRRPAQGD